MLTLPYSAAQASRVEGARVRKAAEWESNPFAAFCARLHAAEGVSSALDRLEVAPPHPLTLGAERVDRAMRCRQTCFSSACGFPPTRSHSLRRCAFPCTPSHPHARASF